MIKDAHLRMIFIPVLGIGLPMLAGIVTYERYYPVEIVFINLYFILVSLLIWTGSNWMHARIRTIQSGFINPFYKIATMCLAEGLYGACIGGLTASLWFQFSHETFNWNNFIKFIILCVEAVIVFTLVYEILFLSREREMDSKKVRQLAKQRSQAELQALTNELDPHFIFNSLNALNHLIINNPQQAHLFNNKLAQVYKYFLINKVRELISLEDELEFITNYFYLLQIRHDNKLQFEAKLDNQHGKMLIPPCALQILMENAIKHNEFTDLNPLKIVVAMNGQYLKISNNVKPKPYAVNSTGIGLKNLRSRYRIICQKEIVIENTQENFTVKLPIIK